MSKVVYLAAGHGGKDPGAVAFGMREKDSNLVVLLKCKEELESHGVKVVCNRTQDVEIALADKVRQANNSGAEIAVSFHANAGGGDGFEAYYYPGSAAGKRLASLCEKHVKEIGQNSRGLKNGDWLYFVKHTTMPAVLVESYFVDNDKDNDIGDTVAEQQRFGVAYAKAILEYLGIAYKAEAAPAPTPAPAPKPTPKPAPAKPTKTLADYVKAHQAWLEDEYGLALAVDGIWGPVTLEGTTKAVQIEIDTISDGIWGPNSRAAMPVIEYGNTGNLVKAWQGLLTRFGYMLANDGIWGDATEDATRKFQRKKGLTVDGMCGKDTMTAALK